MNKSISHIQCTNCGLLKPLKEFYKKQFGPQEYLAECFDCSKAISDVTNKVKKEKARVANLKTNYNLTLEEYDAMLKAQEGVCAICKLPQQNGTPLCVDHCHKTGRVRGLLCTRCNNLLGTAKDSPQTLTSAILYLDQPQKMIDEHAITQKATPMSSYSSPHRTRKKKYPTRPSQQQGEQDTLDDDNNDTSPDAIPPITNFVPDVMPLARPTLETDEEREDAYTRLIQLKMHRLTNKQCGERLGVSERTINNWRKDPIYRDMEVSFIAEAKTGADLLVSDMAYTALKTLNELMDPRTTKSEFTRYSAAKTVGEWLGLNMPREEAHEDSREAVAAFLAKVELEKPRIQINQTNIYTTGKPNDQAALPTPKDADPLVVEASKEIGEGEEQQAWLMPTVLPGGKLPEQW